jgi:hypothetical protein
MKNVLLICRAARKASGAMEKCESTGAQIRVRRVMGVSRRPRGQEAPPLAGVICCAYVLCVARRHRSPPRKTGGLCAGC